jgi:hypothetical protein
LSFLGGVCGGGVGGWRCSFIDLNNGAVLLGCKSITTLRNEVMFVIFIAITFVDLITM